MITSKLPHLLVAAALAFAGGCAVEPAEDSSAQTGAELRKVSNAPSEQLVTTPGESQNITMQPQGAPVVKVNPIVNGAHVLGSPGNDEGPRPHPWTPPPENTEENSTETNGTPSSDKTPGK